MIKSQILTVKINKHMNNNLFRKILLQINKLEQDCRKEIIKNRTIKILILSMHLKNLNLVNLKILILRQFLMNKLVVCEEFRFFKQKIQNLKKRR
jgi:hypothetical protein